MAEHTDGALVGYPAYTSASTRPDGYHPEGNYVVHMEIESVSGHDVEGYGNNNESEILFPRESRFVIGRIVHDADGTPTIYMTEVPYEGEGIQNAYSRNSGREQRPPAQTRKGEVQRLPEQNRGNSEVHSVPGINSEGDLHESDGLSGVQETVTHGKNGNQDASQKDLGPQTITDDRFTIEATQGGTVYVTFPGKPDAAVREALKERSFKRVSKKKACYAKDDLEMSRNPSKKLTRPRKASRLRPKRICVYMLNYYL